MLDLKEELIIGDLLGKGNFAKVHVCVRRTNDLKKYAVKTIEKVAIKKSRGGIVSFVVFTVDLNSL